MNHYDLPLSKNVFQVLALLDSGVTAVGVIGASAKRDGCATCYLQLCSGEVIQLSPTEEYLEWRFEVFPFDGNLVLRPDGAHWSEVNLDGPIEVFLLHTAEWLDATAPCAGALGEGPMLQCQGLPGDVPANAKASVRYFGGVELIAGNGSGLTVVSLLSPYVMHVSDYASSDQFDSANYVRVPLNLACHVSPDAGSAKTAY